MGCLPDGWIEYGERPARLRLVEKYAGLDLVRALPADLAGRTVCVLREQGLGDEIFFLRYAPALRARGARITYRSSEKMRSIFQRVAALDEVIGEARQSLRRTSSFWPAIFRMR
jgi:hypothetical protein